MLLNYLSSCHQKKGMSCNTQNSKKIQKCVTEIHSLNTVEEIVLKEVENLRHIHQNCGTRFSTCSNNGSSFQRKKRCTNDLFFIGLMWNKTQAMRWREKARFGAELKRVISRKYL